MFFHCLQTQAGVFSDLFVTSAFTGQLRSFPLALREPGESRQTERLWPAKCGAVPAEIFARNQKTWSRNTGRFDLSYLNCGNRSIRLCSLRFLRSFFP
jgi:hypothetical protein